MLDPLGSCVLGVTGKLCLPKCMWEFKQAPGIWFIQGSCKLCLARVYVCLGAWCLFVGKKSLFSIVAAETQRWYKLNWINFRHLKKKSCKQKTSVSIAGAEPFSCSLPCTLLPFSLQLAVGWEGWQAPEPMLQHLPMSSSPHKHSDSAHFGVF